MSFIYKLLHRGLGLAALTIGGLGLALSSAHAQHNVQPGTLTVASDLTYPPYVYFEGDDPAGFDADFMRLIAQELGLEIEIIDTRFSDLVLGLRANRFDVIASALYITPERAKQVDYVPYLKTGSALITPKDSDLEPTGLPIFAASRSAISKLPPGAQRYSRSLPRYANPRAKGPSICSSTPPLPRLSWHCAPVQLMS